MRRRSDAHNLFLAVLVAAVALIVATALAPASASFASDANRAIESEPQREAGPLTQRPAPSGISAVAQTNAGRATLAVGPASLSPFGGAVFLNGGTANGFGFALMGLGLTLLLSGSLVLVYSNRRRSRLAEGGQKSPHSLD